MGKTSGYPLGFKDSNNEIHITNDMDVGEMYIFPGMQIEHGRVQVALQKDTTGPSIEVRCVTYK